MNRKIYNWVWKWHFIGGLVSLPIVMLLAITGGIYLFKDNYEKPVFESLKKVAQNGARISYQDQWVAAKQNWDKTPTGIELSEEAMEATTFVSGRFSHKSSLYMDPFSGEIVGQIRQNETDMHKVRKLHGELLLGGVGTKAVELIASWMVVLVLTGIYLFWPRETGWRGLFQIRFKASKRILFRDLHAVVGFWFSVLLLLVLAGGLPWTDVFGSGYKWVQKETNSGFPSSWQGKSYTSKIVGEPLRLDAIVQKAEDMNLIGKVSIALPQSDQAVYSVSNQTSELSSMVVYHFDQYSGELLHQGSWRDIGMMMKTRLWVMAFHQGQFGLWNWVLMLVVAFALFVLSLAAMLSYLKRKKKGEWSVPAVSLGLNIGNGLIFLMVLLAVILPLFGLSLLLIFFVEMVNRRKLKVV